MEGGEREEERERQKAKREVKEDGASRRRVTLVLQLAFPLTAREFERLHSLEIEPILALHHRLLKLETTVLSVVLRVVCDRLLLPSRWVVPVEDLRWTRSEEAREGSEEELVNKSKDDNAPAGWKGEGKRERLARVRAKNQGSSTDPRKSVETARDPVCRAKRESLARRVL